MRERSSELPDGRIVLERFSGEEQRNAMKTWQRSLLIMCGLLMVGSAVAYAQAPSAPPVEFPYTGNRTAVWIVAQMHILYVYVHVYMYKQCVYVCMYVHEYLQVNVLFHIQ